MKVLMHLVHVPLAILHRAKDLGTFLALIEFGLFVKFLVIRQVAFVEEELVANVTTKCRMITVFRAKYNGVG